MGGCCITAYPAVVFCIIQIVFNLLTMRSTWCLFLSVAVAAQQKCAHAIRSDFAVVGYVRLSPPNVYHSSLNRPFAWEKERTSDADIVTTSASSPFLQVLTGMAVFAVDGG